MKQLKQYLKRLFFWLQWPVLYFYFRFSYRSRVLIYDGDKILVVQGLWNRLYGDQGFSLPGGGIIRSETPATGAVRELKEELGISINPEQLVPLGQAKVVEYGIRYQGVFFSLELSQNTVFQIQKSEIRSLRWVELAETMKLPPKPDLWLALQLFRK